MHHHPELVLRIAHDIQRSHVDVAERHRLVRTAGAARRPFFAVRERPPERREHVPWRERSFVVSSAR